MHYVIVELPQLDEIITKELTTLNIELLIFIWFIHYINLKWKSENIENRTFLYKMNHFGDYPGIGIWCTNESEEELEKALLFEADLFFNKKSFLEFYQFIINNKDFINKELKRYNSIQYPDSCSL